MPIDLKTYRRPFRSGRIVERRVVMIDRVSNRVTYVEDGLATVVSMRKFSRWAEGCL